MPACRLALASGVPESSEKPLIILDFDEQQHADAAVAGSELTQAEPDEGAELVQQMLKGLLDTVPNEPDESELTDFEREVLSKYMLEMHEQEFSDKSDAVCHLTATDRQQERDPMKVIGFSPVEVVKYPQDEEGAHDLDRLNNNEASGDATARVDENANQFRIAVSKLDEPPVQQATSSEPSANGGQESATSQQPSTPAVAPTPKVTSSNSSLVTATTDNSANITQPPLANNHSSNIINCTAIPSTTSTTVATITAVSTTNTSSAAAAEDLESHRQKQQILLDAQEAEEQQLLQAQKQRSRAMRRNFSVWVGVTSCVWGILIYLIKSYT